MLYYILCYTIEYYIYIYTYLLQDVVLYNPENKNNFNMFL